MSVEVIRTIENLILPPGGLILLGLLGLILGRRMIGRFIIFLALLGLYLLSTPLVSDRLMAGLEVYPALTPTTARSTGAQAIVVLGGGSYQDTPEYGGDTVGRLFLERLRYAAWLARHTGLPIIPSGGAPLNKGKPEAWLARDTLEQEFQVKVLAVEDKSRTTWENALFTKEILNHQEISRVLLVTHAWHMPRAMMVFEQAGIDATPAPTAFEHRDNGSMSLSDWLPRASSHLVSFYALHEYAGRVWYRLKD